MRQSPLIEEPSTTAMSATPAPAAAPSPEPSLGPVTPSLPRRMACWLYEGTLLFGVIFGTGFFVFGLVFAVGYLVPSLAGIQDRVNNRMVLQLYVFLLLAAYFAWFWTKGQTLAMKTWQIRVVNRHGGRLTWGHALLRYMLSWLWLLPPLAVGSHYRLSGGEVTVIAIGWVLVWAILARFHPHRQFWHDVWAGTRLVSVAPEKPAPKS